jgi:membrane protein implicated in regulation of membrane protease activity
MGDWLQHIALKARSRTGFGPVPVIGYLIAGLSLVIALGFLCAAVFVWLANHYDSVTAGLILAGAFLLIALFALAAAYFARRRNQERARLELAARSQPGWLDPKYLTIASEIGRAVGWRRIAMLAAVGFLAAGLGREWSESTSRKPDQKDGS